MPDRRANSVSALDVKSIENKLEKVTEILVEMGKHDEQLKTIFNRLEAVEKTQTELLQILHKIEHRVSGAWMERVFWIFGATALAYFFSKL